MAWTLGIIGLFVGAGLGGALAWLWAERRGRARSIEIETQLAVAQQRCADLSGQFNTANAAMETLRAQAATADRSAAALSAQLEAARANLAEQKKLLDDAQAQLREAFASVSAEALAKNNEAFLHLAKERFNALSAEAAGSLEQRKAQIEGLLKPLQELLNGY